MIKKIIKVVLVLFAIVVIGGALSGRDSDGDSDSNSSSSNPKWNTDLQNGKAQIENAKTCVRVMRQKDNIDSEAVEVYPGDIVANPTQYLGQVIKFTALIIEAEDLGADTNAGNLMGGKAHNIIVAFKDNSGDDAFVKVLKKGDSTSGLAAVGANTTVIGMLAGIQGKELIIISNPNVKQSQPVEKTQSASKPLGEHWIKDANDVYLWNPKPHEGETITWSGGFVQDGDYRYADGAGTTVWYLNGELEQIDEGSFKHGQRHGRFKHQFFPSGNTDYSNWDNGVEIAEAEVSNGKWNMNLEDPMAASENLGLCIEAMKKMSNVAANANKVSPSDVMNNPEKYMGQVLEFSAVITEAENFPPESNGAKLFGGKGHVIVARAEDVTVMVSRKGEKNSANSKVGSLTVVVGMLAAIQNLPDGGKVLVVIGSPK